MADKGAANSKTVAADLFFSLQSSAMFPYDESGPTFFALLVVGIVLAYFWFRADFVVRVRDGQCRCTGKLPVVVQRSLAQFLLDDIKPRRALTIRGTRRSGRLRLHFWGGLTRGEKQRIRNFLMTHR
jgi:hypothetical protein